MYEKFNVKNTHYPENVIQFIYHHYINCSITGYFENDLKARRIYDAVINICENNVLMSTDQVQRFETVLSELNASDRNKKIFIERFKNTHTLKELSTMFNLTEERLRQILVKLIISSIYRTHSMEYILLGKNEYQITQNEENNFRSLSINAFDFGNRRINYALMRSGVSTIEDLINRIENNIDSFYKIRNLGKKSANTIVEKLKELNLLTL